jgi:hypothetical protein
LVFEKDQQVRNSKSGKHGGGLYGSFGAALCGSEASEEEELNS